MTSTTQPSSRSRNRSHTWRALPLLMACLVWGTLGLSCTGSQTKTGGTKASGEASKWTTQQIPAPPFQLRDLRGDSHNLKDFRGKVVLLNFWATWCNPCLKELQHFQEMHNSYKDKGLEILAVSIDEAQTVSQVGPLVSRYGYNFRVLLDTEGRVVTQYNPKRQSPFSVIIDRKGQIRLTHQGYNPGDEIKMEKKIKSLLQEPTPKK